MRRSLLGAAILLPFLAATAAADSSFLIVYEHGADRTALTNNSSVAFAAERIGTEDTGTFVFTNRGTSAASLNAAELIGSPDFTVQEAPALPAVVPPGTGFSVKVKFKAGTGDKVTSLLLLTVQEVVENPSPGTVVPSSSIVINLVGGAPKLTLAYYLQSDQNVVELAPGGSVVFSDIPTKTVASAAVVVLNRGSAIGKIGSVKLEGEQFQLLGLPLLPADLAAGSQILFYVRYSPKENGAHTGKLTFELAGQPVEIGIQANSVGPVYAYSLIESESSQPLQPGVPLVLSDTASLITRNFLVEVKNTGNAEGTISAINLIGAGFTLTDVPFLPTTLAEGSSLFFGFKFAPVQAGEAIGRLRVGSDNFEIRAVAGRKLAFRYVLADRSGAIEPGGTINLAPVPVGAEVELAVELINEGQIAATVSNLALSGSGYTFGALPAVPLTLEPGAKVSVPLRFSPTGLGTANGILTVDAIQFLIAASGTRPVALPAVSFEGASGVQQPMQQVSVGITLSSPYRAPLRGLLTMIVESPGSDSSIQFTTGGRSVSFTVPSNGTKAVFPNNQEVIRFQTGTLASSIILRATFQTSTGYDLTPETVPALTLTVPPSAPKLLELRIESLGSSGLTLVANGYATSRNLTKLELQFAPASGYRFPADKFSIPLDGPSALFFQSAASSGYGGLFSVTASFSVQGQIDGGKKTLADVLKSVTAVVSNADGSSAPASVSLR